MRKLRDADAMLNAGKYLAAVLQALEVSESTYARWRNQYGGMKAAEAVPTDVEPAHYAQGALQIPVGTERVVIRYRIVLTEGCGERTFDVPVGVE